MCWRQNALRAMDRVNFLSLFFLLQLMTSEESFIWSEHTRPQKNEQKECQILQSRLLCLFFISVLSTVAIVSCLSPSLMMVNLCLYLFFFDPCVPISIFLYSFGQFAQHVPSMLTAIAINTDTCVDNSVIKPQISNRGRLVLEPI